VPWATLPAWVRLRDAVEIELLEASQGKTVEVDGKLFKESVRGLVPLTLRIPLVIAGGETTMNVESSTDLVENVPYAHNDFDREAYAKLLDKKEIMESCEQAGLPFAPQARPQDLFDDPHLNQSGGFAGITLPDGRRGKVPMLPFEMDGRRFGTRTDLPAFGRDSRALLEELGYSPARIEDLEARGIVKG